MERFAVEVEDFSYSYGNGEVIRSLGFRVREGEYVTIVGPNGAGKTTMLKNIMRILTGGTGVIKVKGRDVISYGQKELAREISYVPQSNGKYYPFSVREFVLLSKYPYLNPFSRVTPNDERELEEVLETVHMKRLKDRHMNALSSGERQKVMISASLMQKSNILLLDEPTTFLDPRHQDEINRILKRLNRELNITVVSVTHNLNLAAMLSDKILALKDGRAVYFGGVADFLDNSVLGRIYDKEFKLISHPDKAVKIILPEII